MRGITEHLNNGTVHALSPGSSIAGFCLHAPTNQAVNQRPASGVFIPFVSRCVRARRVLEALVCFPLSRPEYVRRPLQMLDSEVA